MCLNKVFRPDMLVSLSNDFCQQVFGWDLNEMNASQASLLEIVTTQTKAKTPLVFASAPGNDPSAQIDTIAAEHFGKHVGKNYNSMAMGSPEGYALAETAINKSAKKGHWLCHR
eukprot:UN30098